MKEIYKGMAIIIIASMISGSIGWYIGIEDSAYSNKEIISLYHILLTEQNENLDNIIFQNRILIEMYTDLFLVFYKINETYDPIDNINLPT